MYTHKKKWEKCTLKRVISLPRYLEQAFCRQSIRVENVSNPFSQHDEETDIKKVRMLTIWNSIWMRFNKTFLWESIQTAKYPEAKGQVFTSQSIGIQEGLHKKLRTFKGTSLKNPATNNPWSSKEVLLDLLSSEDKDMPW